MKPAGWVDTVQWALPFLAGGTTWFVRGRRADARAAAQDAAVTDKTHADAADVISTAAARTVEMLAKELDKLAEQVEQQGGEIKTLREQRERDTEKIRGLSTYAREVTVYVRMVTALFAQLTGQAAPPAPTPPPGLVPDPDADDGALTIPDAVGGTPSWPTPPPPSPRPAS